MYIDPKSRKKWRENDLVSSLQKYFHFMKYTNLLNNSEKFWLYKKQNSQITQNYELECLNIIYGTAFVGGRLQQLNWFKFQFSLSSQKISPISTSHSFRNPLQGRRKYLKRRGHDTSRALFSQEKGQFLKIKRALPCLLQNLGSTCPHWPPIPTSMILCLKHIVP